MLFVVSGVPWGSWNGSFTDKQGTLYVVLIVSCFPWKLFIVYNRENWHSFLLHYFFLIWDFHFSFSWWVYFILNKISWTFLVGYTCMREREICAVFIHFGNSYRVFMIWYYWWKSVLKLSSFVICLLGTPSEIQI